MDSLIVEFGGIAGWRQSGSQSLLIHNLSHRHRLPTECPSDRFTLPQKIELIILPRGWFLDDPRLFRMEISAEPVDIRQIAIGLVH